MCCNLTPLVLEKIQQIIVGKSSPGGFRGKGRLTTPWVGNEQVLAHIDSRGSDTDRPL